MMPAVCVAVMALVVPAVMAVKAPIQYMIAAMYVMVVTRLASAVITYLYPWQLWDHVTSVYQAVCPTLPVILSVIAMMFAMEWLVVMAVTCAREGQLVMNTILTCMLSHFCAFLHTLYMSVRVVKTM